jgi:hypothetical protein
MAISLLISAIITVIAVKPQSIVQKKELSKVVV